MLFFKDPHLFLPLKVGSHFLKNRIVMAPVETGLEKQDYFDPRVVEFYEERRILCRILRIVLVYHNAKCLSVNFL